MTISIHQLTFHCRWLSEARLPGYLGSTLRGAFGWALKRSCCALKTQECASCMLRQRCGYAWIFETERFTDPDGQRVNARPHPFVLQPGQNSAGERKAGETWDFSLLLIGRAIDYLPHIVYSIQQMGRSGIGAAVRHGFGRFELETIKSKDTVLYENTAKELHNTPVTTELRPDCSTVSPVHSLLCTLETPLRLKHNNTLFRELPFHVLIRAALRRITALESAYGQGEPALDYSDLVHQARQIKAVNSTLRWQETLRYSNRQQQKVSLSGLVGSAEYQGNLTPFVPLLEYGSRVHLGKQTVFGLGKIALQWDLPTPD